MNDREGRDAAADRQQHVERSRQIEREVAGDDHPAGGDAEHLGEQQAQHQADTDAQREQLVHR